MTIAQVSARYGLTADTLRYYERAGLIPPVPRDEAGRRDYDEEACRWIELSKCLRGAGVGIEALSRYVELCRRGEETFADRRALLAQQREMLTAHRDEIDRSLERLDHKIARYDELLLGRDSLC